VVAEHKNGPARFQGRAAVDLWTWGPVGLTSATAPTSSRQVAASFTDDQPATSRFPKDEGDVEEAAARRPQLSWAKYRNPYLPTAPMEPMSVVVKADR